MRSRGRLPRAATSARRLRTRRGPCRGVGVQVAACSEPALRSYLYLRCSRRGSRCLNGTHQIGKHPIEEVIHLLWRAANVGDRIELVGRSANTEALELGALGPEVKQVLRA